MMSYVRANQIATFLFLTMLNVTTYASNECVLDFADNAAELFASTGMGEINRYMRDVSRFDVNICDGEIAKIAIRGKGKGKYGRFFRIYFDAKVKHDISCVIIFDSIELDYVMPWWMYLSQFLLLNIPAGIIDGLEAKAQDKIERHIRISSKEWFGLRNCKGND